MKQFAFFLCTLFLFSVSPASGVSHGLKINKKTGSVLLLTGVKNSYREEALKQLIKSKKNAGDEKFASFSDSPIEKNLFKYIKKGSEKFSLDSKKNMVNYTAVFLFEKKMYNIKSAFLINRNALDLSYLEMTGAANHLFSSNSLLREKILKEIVRQNKEPFFRKAKLIEKNNAILVEFIPAKIGPYVTSDVTFKNGFSVKLEPAKSISSSTRAQIQAGFDRALIKAGINPGNKSGSPAFTVSVSGYYKNETKRGTSMVVAQGRILFSVKKKNAALKYNGSTSFTEKVNRGSMKSEIASIEVTSGAGSAMARKAFKVIVADTYTLTFNSKNVKKKSTKHASKTVFRPSTLCVRHKLCAENKQAAGDFNVFKSALTGKLIAAGFREKPCASSDYTVIVKIYPSYKQMAISNFLSYRTYCIVSVFYKDKKIISEVLSEPGMGLSKKIAAKQSLIRCADKTAGFIKNRVQAGK